LQHAAGNSAAGTRPNAFVGLAEYFWRRKRPAIPEGIEQTAKPSPKGRGALGGAEGLEKQLPSRQGPLPLAALVSLVPVRGHLRQFEAGIGWTAFSIELRLWRWG
jgi:hypothetical protein